MSRTLTLLLLLVSGCESPAERRVREMDRQLEDMKKDVESILGTPRPPKDQLADAKKMLEGKLIRDAEVAVKLDSVFAEIERDFQAGTLDAREVQRLWSVAFDATKDNLVTGEDLDTLQARARAFAKEP